MKNKKIIVLIVLLLALALTGCTKYMSDDKNKKITYEKTGQTLPSNILCKPTDKEMLKLYEENIDKMTVKLDKLPACENFKPNNLKYVSIWESGFVKPLAYIILKVGSFVKNYGISVMIIGLLMRLIMLPLSKNSLAQSENMKKAQPEIMKIEKKYKDKTDKESMMKKSEETMYIYKKYNINPLTGCLFAFIQLPLFFAFLEAVNRVPAIFEGKLLFLQLGTTPLVGISNKNYWYILLIVLIIATTYFSLKNTMQPSMNGQDNAQKQTQFMAKFMLVIISVASLSLPTAIGLYWIVTNAFTVFQNMYIKRKKN